MSTAVDGAGGAVQADPGRRRGSEEGGDWTGIPASAGSVGLSESRPGSDGTHSRSWSAADRSPSPWGLLRDGSRWCRWQQAVRFPAVGVGAQRHRRARGECGRGHGAETAPDTGEHPRGPVDDDGQGQPAAMRIGDLLQDVPAAVRGRDDDLAALRAGRQHRRGADQLRVRGTAGLGLRAVLGRVRAARVQHHPAVHVDQGGGSDPGVAGQRAEHGRQTVGAHVHGVPVPSHPVLRRPRYRVSAAGPGSNPGPPPGVPAARPWRTAARSRAGPGGPSRGWPVPGSAPGRRTGSRLRRRG